MPTTNTAGTAMRGQTNNSPTGSKRAEDLTGRDRLSVNILTSWGGYAVFIVSGFILPRMIDSHLGQFSLGIWDFCWSLVNYLRFSGLGIASSVNRYVAKYRSQNDTAGLCRAISSVSSIQITIASVMFLAIVVLALSLPRFFPNRLGSELDMAKWVVLALGTTLAVRTALNAFHGVITGCHRWSIFNGVTAGSQAVTVAIMLVALSLGGGLRSLAVIYLVTAVITEFTFMALAYRVCPELRLRLADVSWTQGKKMVFFGAKTILTALPKLIVVQTTNIFMVGMLGPAALAVLARPIALVHHLETFMNKFAFVLTPTASSLHGSGRTSEVTDMLVRFLRYSMAITLPIVLMLAVLGDTILHVWMGPDYAPGWTLVILALGYFLPVSQNSTMRILIGMNSHGRVAVISTIVTLATYGLGLLVVHAIGWSHTAAATLVAVSLTAGPGLVVPIFACRRLNIPLGEYLRRAAAVPLACGAVFAGYLFAVRLMFGAHTLIALGVSIAGGAIVLAPLYWYILLSEEERAYVRRRLLRVVATAILTAVYGGAAWMSRVTNRRGRPGGPPSRRILVIGTFHNPNWFHSHMTPLTRCGVGEVIIVCDEPVDRLEGVRYECPPRWLSRLCSRALAKFLWAVVSGIRYRPDLYIGYHIFPAAVSALVVARLLNRPACYQDTSGPLALEGGGWRAENRLLAALGQPSRFIERLVLAVVREFDLIVVRGAKAAAFARGAGYRRRLAVITGSVELPRTRRPFSERETDLVFVGRLSPLKRVDRFIAITAHVAGRVPTLRAAIIGEGPNKPQLIQQVGALGVGGLVEFVGQIAEPPRKLAHARVFVLTSQSEGLSIALMEAMAAGAVPVVSDVGELRHLVHDGVNGFVIDQDTIEAFSETIVGLLSAPDRWEECSAAAAQTVAHAYTVEAVADQWRRHLGELLGRDVPGQMHRSASEAPLPSELVKSAAVARCAPQSQPGASHE